MRKGFYTQGLTVLLEQAVDLDEIAELLSAFQIVKRIAGTEDWATSGPALVLAFRPEVNGLVTVDLVDRPWPDDMSDSKEAPGLFAAWTFGHFGPFTYPGSLERALLQPWYWPEAREVSARHRAFLRLRLTYVAGARMDTPTKPRDCDPITELEFVTSVAQAILAHPRALAYFNPNGEVLRPEKTVRDSLAHAAEHGVPPLDLWSSIRLYNLNEGWTLMDSVGNAQLDTPDHEAIFRRDSFDLHEIDLFLRNVGSYLREHGEVIKDRDTTDGPGGVRWGARHFPESLVSPPRRALRWFPESESGVPQFLLGPKTEEAPKEPKRPVREVPFPVRAPAPVAQPKRDARRPWWKIW